MFNTFQTGLNTLYYDIPHYEDWLWKQDFSKAYEYHQLQMRNILWRKPPGNPILKFPGHMWNLDALANVYPNAHYVWLHRDAGAQIASHCALVEALRRMHSDHVDRAAIGRWDIAYHERLFERLPRMKNKIPSNQLLDIRYEDLTSATMQTVARILEFMDVPLTHEARQQLKTFLAENPLQAHGVHRSTLEAYGLNENEVRERFSLDW
jgi:hypothetical protein